MRNLISIALLLIFASTSDAQLLRRNRSSGACASGSCGVSGGGSEMFSAYGNGFIPTQAYTIPTQAYTTNDSDIIYIGGTPYRKDKSLIGKTSPENVLITTDPPIVPKKITYNGVDFFPKH